MTTVYVTTPPDEADTIAETIIEERLAACVNRFPLESTYRWEGAIHHDDEVGLFVKTTEDAYEELVDRIRELHPHDVPCIERFDETAVLDSYARWRDDEVR